MSSFSERKTRKKKPSQCNPIPSVPYDLVLNCVARVSRLYYPTLSLVSKSFRSLIDSPDLYKARSLLGQTESCLYVCLNIRRTTWFTLCRKPDQTLTNEEETSKKKSSGYVLATVPIPYSHDAPCYGLVAIGSNIYNIGGSSLWTGSSNYSSVTILDCCSHMWSVAPSLPVEVDSLSVTVVDQKIYVAGIYRRVNSFHVLDTKTQIWNTLPIGTKYPFFGKTGYIDGKFHVVTYHVEDVVAYDSEEGRWDVVGQWPGFDRASEFGCCVIDKVLYSPIKEKGVDILKWYDTEVRVWRNLKGLVGLPEFPRGAEVRLADYAGKMAVFWWEYKDKKIWCAAIALERRKSCEIWGKVEWFDHVLTLDRGFDFKKALAATV